MSLTSPDVHYDPYDFEIDADPYPVWKRMRDDAPLYYNEQHDFYALSRFEDVEPALLDWGTFSSGRSDILEIVKANIELPPGLILFEDPPVHDVHRGLLSRVFTPKKMNELEPKVREFCARSLDPLVGTGRFDFIHDLGRADADAHHRVPARHPGAGPGGRSGPARRRASRCTRVRSSPSPPTSPGAPPTSSVTTSSGGRDTPPTTS